jgi:hypothetical protein
MLNRSLPIILRYTPEVTFSFFSPPNGALTNIVLIEYLRVHNYARGVPISYHIKKILTILFFIFLFVIVFIMYKDSVR